MKNLFFLLCIGLIFSQCTPKVTSTTISETIPAAPESPIPTNNVSIADYHKIQDKNEIQAGGVRMIPIETPSGTFKVWTKKVGNNPKIKVLLLHGGPGVTHEYLESFDSFFPQEGFEYYYYDQLGSYYSDQPTDTSLWHLDRFVEEVEQVRKALNLNKDNFYLLGQSWGGILGLQYALKYQEHLKGLVIANMMASIPAYNQYAHEVLGPELPPEVLKKIDAYEAAGEFANEEYLELINKHYYPKHVLRMPLKEWPEPVNRCFKHINYDIYLQMQGPSEFGIAGNPNLVDWDVTKDLPKITVPTLSIGAQHDTMDPEHMKWIATQVKNGRSLHCPNGSHIAHFDDQEVYFQGLAKFINDVNDGFFD